MVKVSKKIRDILQDTVTVKKVKTKEDFMTLSLKPNTEQQESSETVPPLFKMDELNKIRNDKENADLKDETIENEKSESTK